MIVDVFVWSGAVDGMGFVSQAVKRVRREGWSLLPYVFGRFQWVRSLYSTQSRLLRGKAKLDDASTIFPGVEVARAVAALRKDAVYCPVVLPVEVVRELREIAESAELEARMGDVKFSFRYADVQQARLATGEKVLLARVKAIESFSVAQRIAGDPVVLRVMSEYLGYTPTKWTMRLFWSFASEAELVARRRAGQTTEFHFDVHAYNFAYAAYYVLDTDRTNGAHVMIAGSHKDKPAQWLFGSANQPDEAVYAHYPADKVLVIEGPAGTGFWQDSSCYHKALPPEASDRLLFQVRYS